MENFGTWQKNLGNEAILLNKFRISLNTTPLSVGSIPDVGKYFLLCLKVQSLSFVFFNLFITYNAKEDCIKVLLNCRQVKAMLSTSQLLRIPLKRWKVKFSEEFSIYVSKDTRIQNLRSKFWLQVVLTGGPYYLRPLHCGTVNSLVLCIFVIFNFIKSWLWSEIHSRHCLLD